MHSLIKWLCTHFSLLKKTDFYFREIEGLEETFLKFGIITSRLRLKHDLKLFISKAQVTFLLWFGNLMNNEY